MQLSIFRLAPLLGLHALLCLFHLQSRPMLTELTNHLMVNPQAFEQVQFPKFWQPFRLNR